MVLISFSSGKNMGVFKAVGFPEDVGRFYRLRNTKDTVLQHTAATPPTPPVGGEAPIPSLFLIIQ